MYAKQMTVDVLFHRRQGMSVLEDDGGGQRTINRVKTSMVESSMTLDTDD